MYILVKRITMCGRAAQSVATVEIAAKMLGQENSKGKGKKMESVKASDKKQPNMHDFIQSNLHPGCPLQVFLSNHGCSKGESSILQSEKVWGLITKPGSRDQPLPPGPSKHFSSLYQPEPEIKTLHLS